MVFKILEFEVSLQLSIRVTSRLIVHISGTRVTVYFCINLDVATTELSLICVATY